MNNKHKYNIEDQFLHENYEDYNQFLWCGVELCDASGDTIEELKDNLAVCVTDQDGGEITCISYDETYKETRDIIDKLILELINE